MKKIRFTILGLAFTAMFAIGVNAQERGSRGERNARESHVKNKRSEVSRDKARQNNHDKNVWNKDSRIKRVEPTRKVNTTNKDWNRDSRIKRVEPKRKVTTPSRNNSLGNRDFHKNPVRINSRDVSRSTRPVTNINIGNYKKHKHNNINFYSNKGIYYRNYNKGYARYIPSNGFRINVLPIGYSTINLGNRNPYYFYEGVYYRPYKSYYEVVQAPIGAIVYGLPSGYERVRFSGEYVYEFGGTLYQRINHKGNRAYQVIGYLS